MNNEKKEILRLVREDGRNLSLLRDQYKDDIEVVATALLGKESGGFYVFRYASDRLRHDKDLIELSEIGDQLLEIRHKVLNVKMNPDDKEEILQKIEDKKNEVLKQFFSTKEGFKEEKYKYIDFEISDSLKKMIDQGVLGTVINYPNDDMIGQLADFIYDNICRSIMSIRPYKYGYNPGDFAKYISRYSNAFGIPLRNSLIDYYKNNPEFPIKYGGSFGEKVVPTDVKVSQNVHFSLDVLRLALSNSNISFELENRFLEFINNICASMGHENEIVTNEWTPIFRRPLKDNGYIDANDIRELLHGYFDSLDPKEVFRDDSIVVEEVTNTAKEVFTNSNKFGLAESFHATLLNGKIEMATDIGYQNSNRTQDDAIGSVVVDDRHFINIVCDGIGGAEQGYVASKYLVDNLLEWYQSLSSDELDNVDLLCHMLDNKVSDIHRELVQMYGDTAGTTLALALTAGDETIIANVGDSTIYTYNKDTDELKLLSVLDSPTKGLSYEEARHHRDNIYVSNALGVSSDRYLGLHLSIIDNDEQRIILSSDGVTDLISEDTLKYVFRNQVPADPIIQKAKFHPDVEGSMKSADNISVIIADLPANSYKVQGRFH